MNTLRRSLVIRRHDESDTTIETNSSGGPPGLISRDRWAGPAQKQSIDFATVRFVDTYSSIAPELNANKYSCFSWLEFGPVPEVSRFRGIHERFRAAPAPHLNRRIVQQRGNSAAKPICSSRLFAMDEELPYERESTPTSPQLMARNHLSPGRPCLGHRSRRANLADPTGSGADYSDCHFVDGPSCVPCADPKTNCLVGNNRNCRAQRRSAGSTIDSKEQEYASAGLASQ
jgi:hypothetical protein